MILERQSNLWAGIWLFGSIFLALSIGVAWSETAIVGNSQRSSATERNNARLMAMDNEGTLHAVFYDNGIVHSFSTDGAQTWSNPQFRITEVGRNPAIAVGGGERMDLLYKRGGTLAFEIVHRSYNGFWSEETIVYNSPEVPVSRPSLVVDSSGDLHCVWQRSGYGATPNSEVWYCKRTAGVWGAAMNVSNTYGASEYPTMAMGSDDNVHVFWKDSGDNISDPKKVLYRKYTVGEGWDPDVTNVSNTTGNGSSSTMDPCAVVDSQNDLHLVWKDYQPGSKEIFYKKCTAGVWDETPLDLSGTGNASDTPSISVDGHDNLTVAWAEKTDGVYYDVVVREYSKATSLWSTTTNISNTPGSDTRYPNLPVNTAEGMTCLWTEGESSLYDIVCWHNNLISSVGDGGFPVEEIKAKLYPNHPNPFNPATTLAFELPQDSVVTLTILDVSGRLVKTLVSGPRSAGFHRVVWRGNDEHNKAVASGVYFSSLSVNGVQDARKMILLR